MYAGGFGKFIYLRNQEQEFVRELKLCDFTGVLQRSKFIDGKEIFLLEMNSRWLPDFIPATFEISFIPNEKLKAKLELMPLQ